MTGSSVSLAPSLLSIYDHRASAPVADGFDCSGSGPVRIDQSRAVICLHDVMHSTVDCVADESGVLLCESRDKTLLPSCQLLGNKMLMASSDSDPKKRPLSLRSTSSSISSTSSRPQHRRKKIAVDSFLAPDNEYSSALINCQDSCGDFIESSKNAGGSETYKSPVISAKNSQGCHHQMEVEYNSVMDDSNADGYSSLHNETGINSFPGDVSPQDLPTNSPKNGSIGLVRTPSYIEYNSVMDDSNADGYSSLHNETGINSFPGDVSPQDLPTNSPKNGSIGLVRTPSYIDRVCLEIIDTEKAYVRDLGDIIRASYIEIPNIYLK